MKKETTSWFDLLKISCVIPQDIEYQPVELKKCPFCGSLCVSLEENIGGGHSYVAEAKVVCGACKSNGPVTYDWDNKEFKKQAVDLWNNRA